MFLGIVKLLRIDTFFFLKKKKVHGQPRGNSRHLPLFFFKKSSNMSIF